MLGRPKRSDADVLSLQIADAANAFVAEHFEAADMHRAKRGYWNAAIEPVDQHRGKIRSEIDVATGDPGRCIVSLLRHVAHIGEAFGAEQCLGDILRGIAD